MDNCSTHKSEEFYNFRKYLLEQEIVVIFLPAYSPELNPIELLFNKFKIIMKVLFLYHKKIAIDANENKRRSN